MRCSVCGARFIGKPDKCPKCGSANTPSIASYGGAASTVRASWGLPIRTSAQPQARAKVSGYAIFTLVALTLIAAMLMALLIMQRSIDTPQGILIDEATFPDNSFRSFITQYDLDDDGMLTDYERDGVRAMYLSDFDIHDFTGIEVFRNLEVLDASNNAIPTLDVSQLSRLRSATLANSQIEELTLGELPELTTLDVTNNLLSALDLSTAPSLQELMCSMNPIARLDLAANTSLVHLEYDPSQRVNVPLCEGFFPDESLRVALATYDIDGDGALSLRERQSITSLDLKETALYDVHGLMWFESLASLDVSNTRLEVLLAEDLPNSLSGIYARQCSLSLVDLTGLDRMLVLDLGQNPLTQIDLSSQTALTRLFFDGCNLTGTLDVANLAFVTYIDASNNPNLHSIRILDLDELERDINIMVDKKCTIEREALPSSALEVPLDEQHESTTETSGDDEAAEQSTDEQTPTDA